jgi:hypothetical protein
MATITVTEDQLRLIQEALDFYSRVGIGQFNEIKDHPTFYNIIRKSLTGEDGKMDYERYHAIRNNVDMMLVQPRNMLLNDYTLDLNASRGIYNPEVDESCRVAFDLIQVIRHEFWKASPNRLDYVVSAYKNLSTIDSDKIKVEL